MAAVLHIFVALLILFPDLGEIWRDRTAQSAALLKEGKYRQSLKITKGLLADMVEHLGPGSAESEVLAVVLAHRALAEAGLHQEDDALWDWHAACSLNAKVAQSDTSVFGEPGAFLKAHPPAPPLAREGTTAFSAAPPNVTYPKVIKRREPSFPRGAQSFGEEGVLILEVTVDRDGVPHSPRILKALPAPTFTYVALEAMRHWRFTPATLDGQPVEFTFDLTVKFHL
jgi:TonB family protein